MMAWCQAVDELLSEPTMGKYRATYMRHSASISQSGDDKLMWNAMASLDRLRPNNSQ